MSEKHKDWEVVEFPDEKPETFTVAMLTAKKGGKLFGAGKVYVTLLGTQFTCLFVRAGSDKCVVQPEDGPEWLVSRGLDGRIAERLVNDAMARLEEK